MRRYFYSLLASRNLVIFLGILLSLVVLLLLINIFARLHVESFLYQGLLDVNTVPDVLNNYITTYAQIAGGLIILVGLYFTYRRIIATEENVRVAEESQITDRYTRAIEQLNNKNQSIRVGALYGLQRIAKDSKKDILATGMVISSFISEKGNISEIDKYDDLNKLLKNADEFTLDNDIKEAFRIWLRMASISNEEDTFKIADLNLPNLDLIDEKFSDFNIANIKFLRPNFIEPKFYNSEFIQSYFIGGKLYKTKMSECFLLNTDFISVEIDYCNLEVTEIGDSMFRDCFFNNLNLIGCVTLNSSFNNIAYTSSKISETVFTNTKWQDVDFLNVSIADTNFNQTVFSKVSFQKCYLNNIEFNNCVLEIAEWDSTEIEKCKFYGCDIYINNESTFEISDDIKFEDSNIHEIE